MNYSLLWVHHVWLKHWDHLSWLFNLLTFIRVFLSLSFRVHCVLIGEFYERVIQVLNSHKNYYHYAQPLLLVIFRYVFLFHPVFFLLLDRALLLLGHFLEKADITVILTLLDLFVRVTFSVIPLWFEVFKPFTFFVEPLNRIPIVKVVSSVLLVVLGFYFEREAFFDYSFP